MDETQKFRKRRGAESSRWDVVMAARDDAFAYDGRILALKWSKQLAYTITPKSGPMRRMETLLDANRALTNDLPTDFLKRDHWLAAGKLLVHASETGAERDVQIATDELVKAVEREGWMSRVRAERPDPKNIE